MSHMMGTADMDKVEIIVSFSNIFSNSAIDNAMTKCFVFDNFVTEPDPDPVIISLTPSLILFIYNLNCERF